jgi:peptide/nickel transport system substrate-binding protein
MTPGSDPETYQAAQLVAQNWRQLGFQVDITPLEFGRLIDTVSGKKDYQVAILKLASRVDRIDPDQIIYSFLDSQGDYQELNYKSARYDQLADLQRKTLDSRQRQKYVFEAQETAAEDVPMTPILHRDLVHAYRSDLWAGARATLAEGLGSFWNFMAIQSRAGKSQLRFGEPIAVHTLNPAVAIASQDITTIHMIYDKLMRLDENGKPISWAAESVKPSTDGLSYDVALRPGLKFHDGQSLTADDVAFSYTLFKATKGSRFYTWSSAADGVEAVDARHVKFRLRSPYAAFEADSLALVPILPKHIWKDVSDPKTFSNTSPIGSGPFQLKSWQPNQELDFAAYTGHFRPPKIRELIRVEYADVNGMVRGLQSGEVDVVTWWLPPAAIPAIKDDKRFTITSSPEVGALNLEFNLARPPLNNVAVRQALNTLVNREFLLRLLYQGRGQIGTSVIAPGNTFWHNPKVRRYDFDRSAARRILEKAGFRWSPQGQIMSP